MKRIAMLWLLLLAEFNPALVHSNTSYDELPVEINVSDKASLQRGAKIFMNYCSGCHSLRFMRYNRMAQDLGLTTFDGGVDEALLMNNLVFTTAKSHDPIEISMRPEDARQWFGKVPPDLSLSARERGPGWIYTYLKSFYADPKRPFGANNLLIPDVAMPNVLEPLQGEVIAIRQGQKIDGDKNEPVYLQVLGNGEMDEAQLNSVLKDLVTFLVYVSEPAQLVRYDIGVGVLLFLFVLLFFAYRLKKQYWRKIH